MNHLQLFESFLNESVTFKIGDIVELTGSVKRFLVLTDPTIRMSNKFPIKFTAIHIADLDKLKKGDPKGRVITTIQIKEGGYKVIAKGDMKDVELANNVNTEINKSHAQRADKNYEKIAYDRTKYAFGVEMADGEKAFVGDTVYVKFSNGNFKGTIKQIAGNQTGEVMIVFPGKTKGRGIKPDNILRKA